MELMVILPVLFFLMIFTFQIFKALNKAHRTQEEARQTIMTTINHRANGGQGMLPRETVELGTDRIQTQGLPILGGDQKNEGGIPIRMGMCRNEGC